ncbi:thaumatin-like protein 1b [Typha angustifolia]|uniref:thaumatin-like protein 1b n=1 Tax=Typha angustifolia TaxID=59011 RepID=UPI003C2F97B9
MATLTPLLLLLFVSFFTEAFSSTFTITNNCNHAIWPGLLSSSGSPPLSTTGFQLSPGESRALDAPPGWSGRVWARTLCAADPATSRFSCATGDCGSGAVECLGGGAAPPATLAEFTLGGGGGNDFYDVSLVDGYNIAMLLSPQGGHGPNCGPTGCLVDLNGLCPADLRVVSGGASVACKSACEAFRSPQYCCSGDYSSPATCRPSAYSQFFKNACPRAYSYAYDDATSTFTCATGAANYVITFCPTTSSLKSSGGNPEAAGLPLMNDTVVFMRGANQSSYAPEWSPNPLLFLALSSLLTALQVIIY